MNEQEKLYEIDAEGALTFTEAGKTYYSKRYAPYGFRLEGITTEALLKEAENVVMYHLLKENDKRLEALLQTEATSSTDRQFVCGLLNKDTQAMDRAVNRLIIKQSLKLVH